VSLREPSQLAGLDPMLPPRFTAETRSAAAIGDLGGACGEQLTPTFLEAAAANRDQCVVILEAGRIVSFQWLSEGLTWAYRDIWIGFGPGYLYGYNSFTAPSHRGMHLNRSGVIIAAQSLALPKGKGLAGYILASNVASLLAHSRVSPEQSGYVLVWPHGAQGLRFFASSRCRAAGLQLVRRPNMGLEKPR
jgi:hypothetical protein